MTTKKHRTTAQQVAARRRHENKIREQREQEQVQEFMARADALNEMIVQSGILRSKSNLLST